jgi:hypothetical protein
MNSGISKSISAKEAETMLGFVSEILHLLELVPILFGKLIKLLSIILSSSLTF